MEASEEYCLKWNNHQSRIVSVLASLFHNDMFVDCTLAAEGKYVNAHRVVLCACSPFLELLLSQHKDKHPVIFLKDITYDELKAMILYMYHGEVNIAQDQLALFLKAAKDLQIIGLTDDTAENSDISCISQADSLFAECGVRSVPPPVIPSEKGEAIERDYYERIEISTRQNFSESEDVSPDARVPAGSACSSSDSYSAEGMNTQKETKYVNGAQHKDLATSSDCSDGEITDSIPDGLSAETIFNGEGAKPDMDCDIQWIPKTINDATNWMQYSAKDADASGSIGGRWMQYNNSSDAISLNKWMPNYESAHYSNMKSSVGKKGWKNTMKKTTDLLKISKFRPKKVGIVRPQTGETGMDFPCENCGKRYNHKGNLKRHKSYECGKEKQFTCTMCPKSFFRKDKLTVHLKVTHHSW